MLALQWSSWDANQSFVASSCKTIEKTHHRDNKTAVNKGKLKYYKTKALKWVET